MIKIVINRHSAQAEKVEFINNESFDGKFPKPNVDKNVTLKMWMCIFAIIITAEIWLLFSNGYDGFSGFLCIATVCLCVSLSWLEYINCNPCKYDVRCNNEEFVSSDVIWFYARLHFTYAYIGLTGDELTVIMPTSYNDEKLFKYIGRYVNNVAHNIDNVYCDNDVIDFSESLNKSIVEVRNNFKRFDNFICIKYFIDHYVDCVVEKCEPLCYIVKEEK